MLKRCFASFFIVCLVFSVSVLPCFAETGSNYVMDVYIGRYTDDPLYTSTPVTINGAGNNHIITSVSTSVNKVPLKFVSNYFEPASYDRTLFISAGLVSIGDAWFNGVDQYARKPDIYYTDSRDDGENDSGIHVLADAVEAGNDIYDNLTSHGEIFNFQVTIPAYANSIQFDTYDYVLFSADADWTIASFGGFIVDTADNDILALIESILADTNSIDGNITNIAIALNDILVNSNFTTEVLEVLAQKVDVYLPMLDLVNQNVEAIYYLLSDALTDESEAVNQQTQQAITSIQNQANQEAYYQAYMQGSYNRIDLENFDLTIMDSSLGLVTSVFGDMWNALGQWKVLYTFPLFLGMALLVIGRISRTGGGNSSRNSEHKGGEGGA